jgi:hypothetical protein
VLSHLRKFFSWLFLKVAFSAFLTVAAFALCATWLFLHNDPDFDATRARVIANLEAGNTAALTARDETAAQLAALQAEEAAQRGRAAKAAALGENLKPLQHWWKRWITDREQQRRIAEQIERMETLRRESDQEAKRLSREEIKAVDELARCERRLRRTNEQLSCTKGSDTMALYYLNASWWHARWFVFAGLLLYLSGPTLGQLLLFYAVAPRVARGRPVRLAEKAAEFPWLGESRTVVEIVLWPGEVARVRRRYLESVEAGIAKRARLLMSWRIPITSLLTGFFRSYNLHNIHAGHLYRITLSDRKDEGNEMAVVHLPEGGSLVVRPSYLVGIVFPVARKFQMRRHWRVFCWQSLVSGQFRHIEISGPCRLIISAKAGLRAERLVPGETGTPQSCRASPERVIGFTPNLDYRLVRTPRFWNYYRWNHLLYDAHFSGAGIVLVRAQAASYGPLRGFTRLWCTVRDPLLRLLGL